MKLVEKTYRRPGVRVFAWRGLNVFVANHDTYWRFEVQEPNPYDSDTDFEKWWWYDAVSANGAVSQPTTPAILAKYIMIQGRAVLKKIEELGNDRTFNLTTKTLQGGS